MENKTRNYIWNIIILSLMSIGFLVLSVDVGLTKKELQKEISIQTASTVHDFRETVIDGETYYSCNECHFTIRNKPHKDLQLYYDNSPIKATSHDLVHCEKFPISLEFLNEEDGKNFVSKLKAAHDFKVITDPYDVWTSYSYCHKCGFYFRYDGNKMLSFGENFFNKNELLECKE